MIHARTLQGIRSALRKMKFYLLTKKNFLIIMTKNMTRLIRLSTVMVKLSQRCMRVILIVALVNVALLRLLLWPARLLWQGLGMSGTWMLRKM